MQRELPVRSHSRVGARCLGQGSRCTPSRGPNGPLPCASARPRRSALLSEPDSRACCPEVSPRSAIDTTTVLGPGPNHRRFTAHIRPGSGGGSRPSPTMPPSVRTRPLFWLLTSAGIPDKRETLKELGEMKQLNDRYAEYPKPPEPGRSPRALPRTWCARG